MNSMFKLNYRYDIEMNEDDFAAPLTIGLTWAVFLNASVVPSSNFVDFIHCTSRICLCQNVKALVWRWRQICHLKINIFTLNAPISTNEVSMSKLAIEVCFENQFGLIRAFFLSLGSTKSIYFFWDTRYTYSNYDTTLQVRYHGERKTMTTHGQEKRRGKLN